ncbi:MAG: pseudouridine synthase [Kiritimatiellae bacterium]|jgi:23S rRNA pseudouridine2605 synthase|nr:pseudouridine synthase [Kiritimatiellia bacterium]
MSNDTIQTDNDSSHNSGERLQNVLAKRGIASRRGAADIIKAGEVSVNGETIREPGIRVNPRKDNISVQGKKIAKTTEKKKTVLLYKPRGLICSADNSQGDTVCDLLSQQIPERLVPVGRLDKDSEGLLIMSNDGDLTNILTHPRYGHKKSYNVRVSGEMDESKLIILRSRMDIDGYFIKPVEVNLLKSNRNNIHKLTFTLSEGRNRQIRKMCEQVGLRIVALQRTRIGPLRVGNMEPGDWRELHQNDIDALIRKGREAEGDK